MIKESVKNVLKEEIGVEDIVSGKTHKLFLKWLMEQLSINDATQMIEFSKFIYGELKEFLNGFNIYLQCLREYEQNSLN